MPCKCGTTTQLTKKPTSFMVLLEMKNIKLKMVFLTHYKNRIFCKWNLPYQGLKVHWEFFLPTSIPINSALTNVLILYTHVRLPKSFWSTKVSLPYRWDHMTSLTSFTLVNTQSSDTPLSNLYMQHNGDKPTTHLTFDRYCKIW